MAKTKSDLATIRAVAQMLAVVLTVAALFFARDVFIPLALGVLLSFLLSPIVNRLQRFGVPNVLAVVTTAVLAFLLIAGIFTLLGREMSALVSDLPQYQQELVAKARGFAGMTSGMGGSFDKLADEVSEAMEEGAGSDTAEPNTAEPDASQLPLEPPSMLQRWTDRLLPPKLANPVKTHDGATPKTPIFVKSVSEELPLATWANTAGTVLGPLATAGLVSVFALFMLIHREDLRDRTIAVISHGDYVTTNEAMDEVADRISRYLIAQTIINAGYGFVLAIGLSMIGATMTEQGFPNAIMWGVLATCLRFIPYLGPTAAAIFPSAIALAVFPGYNVFIAVVVLITCLELICNNIIEPWFYGASTGISAVAVIIAAVFWGWLWGPVGLLLSTPLTVCLVVLGRYVPRFQILSTLLGEEVEIKPSMRFYHRLLASDEHHASEVLQKHIQLHDFDDACDAVLIPTLKRIRHDHYDGHLSDADANRLFSLAGGMIDQCRTFVKNPTADDQDSEQRERETIPTIIGCTSHHFSETLFLNLLRIGGNDSFHVDTMDDETMPLDVGQHIADVNPPVVVIVVLPQGGFAQARYLCRSIRGKGYTGAIIVACLGKFKNFDTLFVKFRKSGATSMTTSYSQTRMKVESILNQRDPISKRDPQLM